MLRKMSTKFVIKKYANGLPAEVFEVDKISVDTNRSRNVDLWASLSQEQCPFTQLFSLTNASLQKTESVL